MSVLCVGLGLRRLVEIDIILYGAALALEFAALVALRVREPELARPFRVPGGTIGSVAMALPPMALLALAAWQARGEPAIAGMSAFGLSTAIAVVGIAWWAALRLFRRTHPAPEGAPPEPP